MCYEFSSWSWKLRAKQTNEAKVKKDTQEPKSAPAKAADAPAHARPDIKETEKLPA